MKVLTIIPCSGFGTRMGMQPHLSKEMLRIEDSGQEVIVWPIQRAAWDVGGETLVITRPEKTDLIGLLDREKIPYVFHQGNEWAHTVLLSKDRWADINVLILPDTRWDNPEALKDLVDSVKLGANAAFGVFPVEDSNKWSTIKNYEVTEKPTINGAGVAWGCIAFTKEYGEKLFSALQHKNVSFKLENVSFTSLNNFRDITRG